ncbi:MAG: hypothetical protein HKN46_09125 [Acidimicrobiia bacterium]|nr:hypothetical protein [Acidimicrobiia bacterium]
MNEALDRAEAALAEGKGLRGTGFWPAIRTVKQDPSSYDLQRIAEIDRTAFTNWALLTVPIVPGTILNLIVTTGGLGLIAWSYYDAPLPWLIFLLGLGIVWVTTHGLAHLVVGHLQGMRFTHWFIGEITLPQPGVKVDYATYLTVPARQRAWMHAAGAITSKVVPFALIPAAVISGQPIWVAWAVAAFGTVSIATDIAWSTKVSDWKKFRREMALADDA